MDIQITTLEFSLKNKHKKIQVFQNITLRKNINAPFFVSNITFHQDLFIKSVEKEITIFL